MASPAIRVLHVDDDASFSGLVEAFLEGEPSGFEVDTATDVADALKRLGDGVYDCAVSDFEMPDADGLTFLRAVRERRGPLPFVLFTGKGSEEIASAALSAGADEYLQKGTGASQFEVLANRVSNLVARDRAKLERERLSRQVRCERDHFKMALRHSPVVAFRLDTDLRYVWVGNPHTDFEGVSVVGKRDDELLPSDAAEIVVAPKREALETGRRVRRQVRYDLPGGPVSYDLTVEPIHGPDGSVEGLACVAVELPVSTD